MLSVVVVAAAAAALLFTLEHSVSLFFLLIFQFVCLALIPPARIKTQHFYLVQSWLQVAFLMRCVVVCRAANAFDPFQLGGVHSEHVAPTLHSPLHSTLRSTIHTPLVHCASKINPWEAHSQLLFLNFFFYLFFHTIKCTKKLTESESEAEVEIVASRGGNARSGVVSQLQFAVANYPMLSSCCCWRLLNTYCRFYLKSKSKSKSKAKVSLG